MQRKDCCLNFFKNGFRKMPSCNTSTTQPQAGGLESKKEIVSNTGRTLHAREESNLEMFMGHNDIHADDCHKVHEIEMEFIDKAAAGHQLPQSQKAKDDRAAQVAFETNSSIGSENCSIDSIAIADGHSTQISNQGRASFWRYFFKSKPTNPHPSKHLQFVEAAQTEDMHTI